MKTTQEIIENQEEFKNQIFSWLHLEFDSCKKTLNSIKSKDSFIQKEKKNCKLNLRD